MFPSTYELLLLLVLRMLRMPGLRLRAELEDEAGGRHVAELDRIFRAAVCERERPVFHGAEDADEDLLALDRRVHLHLRLLPAEADEVALLTERPLDAGRADLEVVAKRDHVDRVEGRRELTRDARAEIEIDGGLLRRRVLLAAAELLDIDAKNPAPLLALELEIDHLPAVRAHDGVHDRSEAGSVERVGGAALGGEIGHFP